MEPVRFLMAAVPSATVMLVALALAGGLPTTLDAHEGTFSAGKPGHPKRPYKTVTVSMHEGDGKMYYVPERLEVKRGAQVKFIIKNEGLLAHEFILADTPANLKHAELMQKYPDMEHDDPNGKTVQPNKTAEILWHFNKRGEFEYGCLIPGHREAGMTGRIIVK
jgi:uncharacterized cupredoxin-like copper-binding protein